MSPHLLKTFVQNRVTEINEFTGDARSLHITSKGNPTDLSRGLNFNALRNCELWWQGPVFLRENSSDWLNNKRTISICDDKPVNLISVETMDFVDFNRFSNYKKLIHTGAYVLRFIKNRRLGRNQMKKCQTGLLSADELAASTWMLQSFNDVYSCLSNSLSIRSSKNKKQVNQIASLHACVGGYVFLITTTTKNIQML